MVRGPSQYTFAAYFFWQSTTIVFGKPKLWKSPSDQIDWWISKYGPLSYGDPVYKNISKFYRAKNKKRKSLTNVKILKKIEENLGDTLIEPKNTIRNETDENSPSEILIKPKNDKTNTIVIIAVIVPTFLLLSILSIIICICKKRKQQKKSDCNSIDINMSVATASTIATSKSVDLFPISISNDNFATKYDSKEQITSV